MRVAEQHASTVVPVPAEPIAMALLPMPSDCLAADSRCPPSASAVASLTPAAVLAGGYAPVIVPGLTSCCIRELDGFVDQQVGIQRGDRLHPRLARQIRSGMPAGR
jgi:hypothetical protein